MAYLLGDQAMKRLGHAPETNTEPSWLQLHRLGVVQAISTFFVIGLVGHDAIHHVGRVIASHINQNVVFPNCCCYWCGGTVTTSSDTLPQTRKDRLLIRVIYVVLRFPSVINPVFDHMRQMVEPEFQWWLITDIQCLKELNARNDPSKGISRRGPRKSLLVTDSTPGWSVTIRIHFWETKGKR